MPARKSRVLAFAVAATALLASAAPANAGPLVDSAPGCESPNSIQRFAQWMDPAYYFLAPDGSFDDDGAGWALSAAAAAADGTLSLPDQSSATSPTMCVGVEHPTVRFFLRQTGGAPLAYVRVTAQIEDNAGLIQSVPMGAVGAGSSWQPSPQVVLTAALLPLLPGDHTPVRIEFEAVGGDFEVDELWIDPTGSH